MEVLIIKKEDVEAIKTKLNSIWLFLSAHPDCTEFSEMLDRLEDVNEISELLPLKPTEKQP